MLTKLHFISESYSLPDLLCLNENFFNHYVFTAGKRTGLILFSRPWNTADVRLCGKQLIYWTISKEGLDVKSFRGTWRIWALFKNFFFSLSYQARLRLSEQDPQSKRFSSWFPIPPAPPLLATLSAVGKPRGLLRSQHMFDTSARALPAWPGTAGVSRADLPERRPATRQRGPLEHLLPVSHWALSTVYWTMKFILPSQHVSHAMGPCGTILEKEPAIGVEMSFLEDFFFFLIFGIFTYICRKGSQIGVIELWQKS